jgi:hypothetical protein
MPQNESGGLLDDCHCGIDSSASPIFVSLNCLPSFQKGITVRVHYLYLVDDNEITAGVVSDLTLCNDMNACMKIMSLADCVLE